MKKPSGHFLTVSFLSMVWILNISFKSPSQESAVKLGVIDTINRSNLPLYADTTLYSGFMGNFAIIQKQLLNDRRIDSLLKAPIPVYYKLTKEDKEKYVFNINQNAINKTYDTILFKDKIHVIDIPLKFTNYSDDTLKYLGMDCTWLDCFFTDNKRVKFLKQICFKNEPCVNTIPPHQSINIYIPIVLDKNIKINGQKFRVGMSLQKYIEHTNVLDFDPFKYFLRAETSNMIWSNEVRLP